MNRFSLYIRQWSVNGIPHCWRVDWMFFLVEKVRMRETRMTYSSSESINIYYMRCVRTRTSFSTCFLLYFLVYCPLYSPIGWGFHRWVDICLIIFDLSFHSNNLIWVGSGDDIAWFANRPISSLSVIPVWEGTHINWVIFFEFDVMLSICRGWVNWVYILTICTRARGFPLKLCSFFH